MSLPFNRCPLRVTAVAKAKRVNGKTLNSKRESGHCGGTDLNPRLIHPLRIRHAIVTRTLFPGGYPSESFKLHHSGDAMLGRLLESKKEGERSIWGAIASTIAHTVAIGVAVFATAQARIDERPPAQVVRWVTPPVARPVAPPAAIAPRRRSEQPAPAATRQALAIDRIDLVIPPIDLASSPQSPGPEPLADGPVAPGPPADATMGVASAGPFSADQVERQVYLRRGSPAPRYPDALRAAGIEGQVIVLFVVNEGGRVELSSVRFTRSDSPLFEAAVRDALGNMRFGAAEVGGKKVRQLVQMPFVFSLTR